MEHLATRLARGGLETRISAATASSVVTPPRPSKSHVTEYRPDIDGLRAIGVMAVVLYHANARGFAGGFVGVDVFFVVSGFLITSVLTRFGLSPTLNITTFYERRFRRIIPPLYAMLLITSVIGYAVLPPDELRRFGTQVAANLFFGANFVFWRTTGYFEPAADSSPLVHTWSLGVEEQFYLLFPIVFLWLFRRNVRIAKVAVICAAVLSFGACVYLTLFRSATAAFYLAPTRAWELLTGSCLAFTSTGISKRALARNVLSTMAIVAILAAVVLYDPATPFPGFFAMIPVLATAVLIDANRHEKSLVGRLLASSPLTAIGLISYSLYLWHWPLLVFARHITPSLLGWQTLAVVLGSVVAAVLSWRLIERPSRDYAHGTSFRRIVWFSAIATIALLTFCALNARSGGWRSRYPATALAYLDGAADRVKGTSICPDRLPSHAVRGDLCRIGWKSTTGPAFLLWGDSHAAALIPVIDSLAQAHHVTGVVAAMGGCPPFVGVRRVDGYAPECEDFNAAVSVFAQQQRIPNVVLVAYWSAYSDGLQSNARYYRVHPFLIASNRETPASLASSRQVFRAGLRNTLHALRAANARVFIIEQVPRQPIDVPHALAAAVLENRDVATLGLSATAHRTRQQAVSQMFAEAVDDTHVFRLDPALVFCRTGKCQVAQQGRSLYADDNHLSTFGASRLNTLLSTLFRSLAP